MRKPRGRAEQPGSGSRARRSVVAAGQRHDLIGAHPGRRATPHLHDPDGARFRILDSKTETGIRELQMTPALVEAVVNHLDRLRRAGRSTGPHDYLVQSRTGGRISRERVGTIVKQAAELATERRSAQGLPPMPPVSPHSLRRTYISIALRANQFDVKWVMSQVGHADSRMTMDVYAQLEQRVDRSHGENFDRLLAAA